MDKCTTNLIPIVEFEDDKLPTNWRMCKAYGDFSYSFEIEFDAPISLGHCNRGYLAYEDCR